MNAEHTCRCVGDYAQVDDIDVYVMKALRELAYHDKAGERWVAIEELAHRVPYRRDIDLLQRISHLCRIGLLAAHHRLVNGGLVRGVIVGGRVGQRDAQHVKKARFTATDVRFLRRCGIALGE